MTLSLDVPIIVPIISRSRFASRLLKPILSIVTKQQILLLSQTETCAVKPSNIPLDMLSVRLNPTIVTAGVWGVISVSANPIFIFSSSSKRVVFYVSLKHRQLRSLSFFSQSLNRPVASSSIEVSCLICVRHRGQLGWRGLFLSRVSGMHSFCIFPLYKMGTQMQFLQNPRIQFCVDLG